uniref:Uncharacterized protein n=1 Tax=Manihot esculenta TaxID=3983 RepID=A0A199UB47_MANES
MPSLHFTVSQKKDKSFDPSPLQCFVDAIKIAELI